MHKRRITRLGQQLAAQQQMRFNDLLARYDAFGRRIQALSERAETWTQEEADAIGRWGRIQELLERARQRKLAQNGRRT